MDETEQTADPASTRTSTPATDIIPHVAAGSDAPLKQVTERAAKFTSSALAATWSFSRKAAADLNAKRLDYLARQQAEAAERQRHERLARFDGVNRVLRSHAEVLHPKDLASVDAYAEAVGRDDVALAAFADHPQVLALCQLAETKAEILAFDRAFNDPAHLVEEPVERLFTALGPDRVKPTLQAIAASYQVSNAGNIIAGSVMAARRNYGGLLLSVNDSVRTGHHNGAASGAFTEQIYGLHYSSALETLGRAHGQMLRYAYRLRHFDIGDAARLDRLIFSLVYNNGRASPRLPQPVNKFTPQFPLEFHNNFCADIFPVSQAIADLTGLREAGGTMARTLWQAADLAPVLSAQPSALPRAGVMGVGPD
ncbi:hypothetical protein BJF92_16675 [Rhizobium rhizosphaerae]|uniref:Uncharacterized protein n=1 Tax=Xaviernesmea rhizosphaerae TaxID=1672749 RepID=A0A1Q9AII7_9HYPH|nr:hypothetical protein [Xaviernesmea rhizosphaerae]OLP55034.1 hypothetical protein BJF92_16675 [Xaviernesmea rhizosphaerae]